MNALRSPAHGTIKNLIVATRRRTMKNLIVASLGNHGPAFTIRNLIVANAPAAITGASSRSRT